MRRNEFLRALSRELKSLTDIERERYLANYAELLDDKMEAGASEEAAIAALGEPAQIAAPILADAREQGTLKPKRGALNVSLLALGSPVWLAFAIAGLAVIIALYAAAWAIIVALCAAELSLFVALPAGIAYCIRNYSGNLPFSLFTLGAGLVCAGAALALWEPLKKLIAVFASFSAKHVSQLARKIKSKGSALL